MGFNRYARKADKTQPEVMETLRACGYQVWDIGLPDDLLVWHPKFGANWFRMLSVKTPDDKGRMRERKDRAEQNNFCAMTGTPRVGSGQHALMALEAP